MLLLDRGSNPNSKDSDGSTPLHLASESGHIKVIICMLASGKTDPTQTNNYGQTPSDIAMNIETRQAFEEFTTHISLPEFLENQIL